MLKAGIRLLLVGASLAMVVAACDKGTKGRTPYKAVEKAKCQRGLDTGEFNGGRAQALSAYRNDEKLVRTVLKKFPVDHVDAQTLQAAKIIVDETNTENQESNNLISVKKDCVNLTATLDSASLIGEQNPDIKALKTQAFDIVDITATSIELKGEGVLIKVSDITADNKQLTAAGETSLQLNVSVTENGSTRDLVLVQNSGLLLPNAEVELDSSVAKMIEAKHGAGKVNDLRLNRDSRTGQQQKTTSAGNGPVVVLESDLLNL